MAVGLRQQSAVSPRMENAKLTAKAVLLYLSGGDMPLVAMHTLAARPPCD